MTGRGDAGVTRLTGSRYPGATPPRPSSPGLVEGSSDAELARKLRAADDVALSELYQRFGQPCYALAQRICGDDGLAEDVVHEVFQTLWQHPGRVDSARGSVSTWLLTRIHRKAVDTLRSTGRRADTAVRAATDAVVSGPIRAALDRLPGEQRQVVAAVYFGGYTLPEIAASTSVSLDTVKTRMFDGVRRLRSLLTEQLGPNALISEAHHGWER